MKMTPDDIRRHEDLCHFFEDRGRDVVRLLEDLKGFGDAMLYHGTNEDIPGHPSLNLAMQGILFEDAVRKLAIAVGSELPRLEKMEASSEAPGALEADTVCQLCLEPLDLLADAVTTHIDTNDQQVAVHRSCHDKAVATFGDEYKAGTGPDVGGMVELPPGGLYRVAPKPNRSGPPPGSDALYAVAAAREMGRAAGETDLPPICWLCGRSLRGDDEVKGAPAVHSACFDDQHPVEP